MSFLRGALPHVRWSAVFAGVMFALAAQILLGLIGVTLGLAAAPADSSGLGIGAGVWGILTIIVSYFLGAWVAARVSGAIHASGANIHGLLVWCVSVVGVSLFLGGLLGNAIGAAGSAAARLGSTPRLTEQQADEGAARSAAGTGTVAIAALLGLAAAWGGAVAGRRSVLQHAAGRTERVADEVRYGYPREEGRYEPRVREDPRSDLPTTERTRPRHD